MSKNLRELVARNAKKLAVAGTVTAATLSGTAMAAAGDYSSIGAGIDTADVIAGILAFGVIKVGPGFARWATNKVAGFFG
jgi:hypothetical protein